MPMAAREGLAELLAGIGIAAEAAADYAAALVDDGFDTPAAFAALSLDELQSDFNFKRGHLRMVEKSRESPPVQVDPQLMHSEEAPLATAPSVEALAEPEPEDGAATPTRSSPSFKAAATAVVAALPRTPKISCAFPPERTIFGSMRFPIPDEALDLRGALATVGILLKIIELKPGQDISTQVFLWIEYADTFLVFGSQNYGEDTGNPASTHAESKYAQNLQKRIVLLRMIPWDAQFDHLQGRVMFGMNQLTLDWPSGTPMPPDLVGNICAAIDGTATPEPDSPDSLNRSASMPLTGDSHAAQRSQLVAAAISGQLLDTAEEFARACASSIDELLTLSNAELKELMAEQEESGRKIGVLGRKRILGQISRLQAPKSPRVQAPPADELAEPEPQEEFEQGDEDEEEEPDIMLVGDEEHVNMLLFLSLQDLASMAAVSRHWRTLISDDFFWERKWMTIPRADPHSFDGSLPRGVRSYRTAYRQQVQFFLLPGTCLEVLDTYNIWSVARVVLVLDANRFLIWFEGWGDEWLMWLDRRYDLARIRGCRAEVAGLGKRGPLQCEDLLRKQEQALLIIADAVPGVYPETFPDSHCWRVPAANTTQ